MTKIIYDLMTSSIALVGICSSIYIFIRTRKSQLNNLAKRLLFLLAINQASVGLVYLFVIVGWIAASPLSEVGYYMRPLTLFGLSIITSVVRRMGV